jgi:hypothetical protein
VSRLRPPFVVALVVAALGAGTAIVVPEAVARIDETRREQAFDEARAVPAPAGVTLSTDCPGQAHGAGIVACWQSDGTVDDLTAALLASMERQTDEPVQQTCVPAPVPPSPMPPQGAVRSCVLALRHGDRHGVFVFVDPRVARQGADGRPVVTGSVVTVAAN